MLARHSDFPFIGARDYVHGPTLFEAFHGHVLELAGEPATAGFSFRFLRVNQPIRANGTIAVLAGDEARPAWGRPAAEMSCDVAGRSWYAAFYERDATPIARRVEARERSFVSGVEVSGPLSGAAALGNIRDNADLFQAVIEANKQVHLKSLTGDPLCSAMKFRFAYCLDYRCAPSIGAGRGRAHVQSMGLRKVNEHDFSLTTIRLELDGFRSSFSVCFASRDMQLPRAQP